MLPVTVTVYTPGAAVLATVKEPEVITPLVKVHTGAGATAIMLVGVLATEKHVSAGKKLLPVIDTPVPAGPILGVSVIVGVRVVTVNGAETDGVNVWSMKVIVYVPAATFAT